MRYIRLSLSAVLGLQLGVTPVAAANLVSRPIRTFPEAPTAGPGPSPLTAVKLLPQTNQPEGIASLGINSSVVLGLPALAKDMIIDDRFVIEDLIAAGGAGRLYRVRDTRTGQVVALKELAPNPELPWRTEDIALLQNLFIEEARLLAKLAHENIPKAEEAFLSEGRLFFPLEFIEGETLEQRVSESGPLDTREALDTARTLSGTLHYLHSQGIVHRDINPKNIIDRNGTPMLVDFGIASAEGSPVPPLGTLGFAPYEQTKKSSPADKRADVYSLAATLHYAVTGADPQQAKNPFHLEPAGNLRPEIPAGFSDALDRALLPDPQGRPTNMPLFFHELEKGFSTPSWSEREAESSRTLAALKTFLFSGEIDEDFQLAAANTVENAIPLASLDTLAAIEKDIRTFLLSYTPHSEEIPPRVRRAFDLLRLLVETRPEFVPDSAIPQWIDKAFSIIIPHDITQEIGRKVWMFGQIADLLLRIPKRLRKPVAKTVLIQRLIDHLPKSIGQAVSDPGTNPWTAAPWHGKVALLSLASMMIGFSCLLGEPGAAVETILLFYCSLKFKRSTSPLNEIRLWIQRLKDGGILVERAR